MSGTRVNAYVSKEWNFFAATAPAFFQNCVLFGIKIVQKKPVQETINLSTMSSEISTTQLPKLPENQKTFAGIPEAVFVVSFN